MSFSSYAEDLVLNWAFTVAAVTRPAAWYVAIHNGDPGADGSLNEQIVANDAAYVRQAVTMGAAASGQSLNTTAVNYTPDAAAADFTVTYLSIWDASTVGNCIIIGPMQVSRTINNANPLAITIGDLIAALA